MKEEKVVYLVEGKVDIKDLREFCDGACYKEFGRPAFDWEIGKELSVSDRSIRKKLLNRMKRTTDGNFLTIRPVGVGSVG